MQQTPTTTNGNRKAEAPPLVPELPEENQAAYASGMAHYQAVVAERNRLAREVYDLKSQIAAHKVAVEAQQAQLADAESRISTATLLRDQAVADRAKFESLFIAVFAQMRAFKIPAAPLVTEANPDADDDDRQH